MHDDLMVHERNNRLRALDLTSAAARWLLVRPADTADRHRTSEGLSVNTVPIRDVPGKDPVLERCPGMPLVGMVSETELLDAEALAPEGMVGPPYAAVLLGSGDRGRMRGSGT